MAARMFLMMSLILTGLPVAAEAASPAGEIAGRVKPWPSNPHYLAWGETPVFLLGATDYHGWTPISRPGTMHFQEQLDRLARVIDQIGSPHVCGFVRCLPYDPMNHIHDGAVKEVLQPWVKLASRPSAVADGFSNTAKRWPRQELSGR